MRVALVLATVGDLSGSGGTERQFSDLFDYLVGLGQPVDLITTEVAVRRLREAGRLASGDRVITLPLGDAPGRGKLGILWLTAALLWTTIRHRWDVVHLCQPTPAYVPYAAFITSLPRRWRPKVTMTVVDCTLAPNLMASSPPEDLYERQVLDAHRMYAGWTKLDGIFSWYQLFIDVAARLSWFTRATLTPAKYCFTDIRRFAPAPKQAIGVYAGRFSAQKRPLLFVDAIASLDRRHGGIAREWRFVMYGVGPLEPAVRARVDQLGLRDRIEISRTPDMAPVLASSKLFISTQAHDNFTSLAMLEAMASGNAVIAEDAGQTRAFVPPGVNGLLVPGPATADAFADAIANYISRPDEHQRMADASRRLAADVHTIGNFADDIMSFWSEVGAARTGDAIA